MVDEDVPSGLQSCFLVFAFAAAFLALEHVLAHSFIADFMLRQLKKNKGLKPGEAERCVPMVVTRLVGFVHNGIQVPIGVWVICHPELRSDRFHARHPLSYYMLCMAAGFFLHDAVSCLIRESPFYIIHGLTCCLGYAAGAVYGVGHFYGGLFLMWEVSTPFVQLRWILYKMGLTEIWVYKVNGLLMVFTFGVARILCGTYFTYLLLTDAWQELRNPQPGSDIPSGLYIGFSMAAVTISILNYHWFNLMVRTLAKIFLQGRSWNDASQGKNE